MSIQYKKFIFSRSPYRSPQFQCIRIAGDECRRSTLDVTDATYDRFVRLADSDAYHVSILPADEGMAWQLVRLSKHNA